MNIQSVHLEKGDILVVQGCFDEQGQKLMEAKFRAAFEAVGIRGVAVMFLPLDVDLTVLKR